MAQPPSNSGQKVPPQNDLYTFMLILAALMLLGGIAFVAWRTIDMFGTIIPPAAA